MKSNACAAFAEATTHLLTDPQKLAEAQLQHWQDSLKLWQSTAQRMMGGEAEPVAAPERGDRRFKDIWNSDRYWEVMNYIASAEFNAQSMCGSLCLQHKVNEFLDGYHKGQLELPKLNGQEPPQHIDFV